MKMPMLFKPSVITSNNDRRMIWSLVIVVVLLVVVGILSFTVGKMRSEYEVKGRSACISNELETDYISSDLGKCLCEEGGNESHVIVLDDGRYANVCILKGVNAN